MTMRSQTTSCLLMGALVLALGCSDDPQLQQGTEGAACFANNTCKTGLTCEVGTCTRPADGAPPATDGGLPDQLQPDMSLKPLSWTGCDTSAWPAGYPKPASGVQCTFIEVPLDHKKPGGKTMKLRVGRHKSTSFPTGRAVFNLAGGPGGAATYQAGVIPLYMPGLRSKYDLIYVDQRGTGGSDRLACAGGYPDDTSEWITCAGEHKDKALDHYLTEAAAHDLDLVRRRLGYKKVFLRGGSYGTRMGLEYMRQYGDKVTAAVLDGLAPPDWDIFAHNTRALEDAITKLVADCNADSTCKSVVPDLASDLKNRRAALKKTPRPISVGGQLTYETEAYFIMFLHALLDRTSYSYQVPRAIRKAMAGDNSSWNMLMGTLWGYTVKDAKTMPPWTPGIMAASPPPPPVRVHPWPLSSVEYVAPGLLLTVMCAEWFPNSGGMASLKAKAAQRTWVRASALDLPAACASVKVQPISATLRKAVSSNVNTLLLSGEIDIRTPASMGTHAAKTLPNSVHVVIPYASHSTISNTCAVKMITAFFDTDGDVKKLDTSCTKTVAHPGW